MEYIDCDKCLRMDWCFGHCHDNNGKYGPNWLRHLSQCRPLNYDYSRGQDYSGIICNANGTGIEVGVFSIEGCLTCNPTKSFGNIMTNSDSFYYKLTKSLVETIFTSGISCAEPAQVQYTRITTIRPT